MLSNLLAKKVGESLINTVNEKMEIHYSQIQGGDKIRQLLGSGEKYAYKEAERLLREAEGKYRENKQKKWVVFAIGIILGGLIGYFLPIGVFKLSTSTLLRGPIDNFLSDMFGAH